MRTKFINSIATLYFVFGMGTIPAALACELCESQQPAMWRGITHGPGPEGDLDHLITWSAVVIVGVTLYLSIKFLVKPKENQAGHIKNIVVNK